MTRRQIPVAALTLLCALALAACGASASNHTDAAKAGGKFMAYSVCMRSHGVPSFPDPSPGGGIQLPAGVNVEAPSFKHAQGSCQHLLPGGGPGAKRPSKQQMTAAVRTSQCMRSHGVSGFPDPTTSPPANPQNYSEIGDRGGVVIAIPKTIDVNSPVYENAAKACGFP